jgi:hypothetical protein
MSSLGFESVTPGQKEGPRPAARLSLQVCWNAALTLEVELEPIPLASPIVDESIRRASAATFLRTNLYCATSMVARSGGALRSLQWKK